MDTLVNYANRCRLQYTYSPVVASLPRRKLQRAYHTHPSNYHSLCSFTYLQNFLFKQNSPSPFHFLSHLPDTHTCSHRRVLLYRRFPQANTRQMEHHRAPKNAIWLEDGRLQKRLAIGVVSLHRRVYAYQFQAYNGVLMNRRTRSRTDQTSPADIRTDATRSPTFYRCPVRLVNPCN